MYILIYVISYRLFKFHVEIGRFPLVYPIVPDNYSSVYHHVGFIRDSNKARECSTTGSLTNIPCKYAVYILFSWICNWNMQHLGLCAFHSGHFVEWPSQLIMVATLLHFRIYILGTWILSLELVMYR